jgi:cupin 2 domain-containing protein
MPRPSSLFADLSRPLPEELITTLLHASHCRIERIVSHGHASPPDFWYDQDEHEWVVVLRGAARLRFDDGVVDRHPGDYINIPAHTRHRVDCTTPDQPTIWLTLHYDERQASPPSR